MSKVPVLSSALNLAGSGLSAVSNAFKGLMPKMPDVPDPAGLPTRGAPSDPAIEKRATEQFATREQDIQRQASAAGAQRSENDADLLGYTGPKKKSASRRLLGE